MILSENGVDAARQALVGSVLTHCLDCGDAIAPARRENAVKLQMKCVRCIVCQEVFDKKPRQTTRMLDRIL
jgi:RNA polymerase-binding transcription factor DksA